MKGLGAWLATGIGDGHLGLGHCIYPVGDPKTGDIPGEIGIPIGTGLIGCLIPVYVNGDAGWAWWTGVGGPRVRWGCGELVGLKGEGGLYWPDVFGLVVQLPPGPGFPWGFDGGCDIFSYFEAPRVALRSPSIAVKGHVPLKLPSLLYFNSY